MESIAIIGTGIAGMGAAHFLHKKYNITIFEQNNYVGGHTNTATVYEDGKKIPVDTGFIVFNTFTYPNLVRLFGEIGAEYINTDMSFSVQHVPTGLEYNGSNLDGLFAQRKNIFNPRYIRMLLQINRFNEQCIRILDNPEFEKYSLAEFIKEFKYSDDFIYKYLAPMTSALWSTPTDITLKFPVVALVRFFKNHGFLGLHTQFQWLTTKGGSWQYRDKLIAPFKDKIHLEDPVIKVYRENRKVRVVSKSGEQIFDKVVFASHADQTLSMLGDANETEKKLLGKFSYQKNIATLHSDISIMPKTKKAWSAWNYRIEEKDGKLQPSTIYWMNLLQNLNAQKDYFISINDPGNIDPSKIVRTIEYHHPVFTTDGFAAQKKLHNLNANGVSFFCGSYFKYGFHEDAFTSAVEMCRILTGEKIWGIEQKANPVEIAVS